MPPFLAWRLFPMAPIKLMSVADADTKYRQSKKSAITLLPEWIDMRTRLAAEPLKPFEALVISLATDAKQPHRRASFKRNLKKYLKKIGLSVYGVRAMRVDADTD